MVDQLLSAFGDKMIINSYRYAGVGFTPPDIAGLELWYDQSDITTLWTDDGSTQVTTGGDLVYRWDDKSGNGGHAKQTTEGSRPTYQTTGVQFDGGDLISNVLYVPAGLFSTNTLFCVMRTSAGSGTHCGFSGAESVSDIRYISVSIIGSNGKGMLITRNAAETSFAQTTSTGDNDGNNHVVTGSNVGDTSHKIWVDGGGLTDETSSVTTTNAIDTVSLGAIGRSTPVDHLTGFVCEAIWYDSALGDTDRQTVEAYLMSKWGI